MRLPRASALVVLLLGATPALTGCAGDTDSTTSPPAVTTTSDPTTPRSTAASPSPSPSTSGAPTAPAGAKACDEVVAGIDDFNSGDFDGTVAHFRAAVPLAEAEAQADPGPTADDLLAAVRYYADLPADQYLEASAGSPDFAKYKAITLGQCASDGPTGPEPPSSSGVTI